MYMNQVIPEFFRSILWSSDFSILEPERNKILLITQAINYGDLRHWHWIANHYGAAAVATVIEQTPMTALRLPAYLLAKLIFPITNASPASRVTHA